MPFDILVGLQFGDEGKGKIVDSIAQDYNIIVRFNGGNNAGHTVTFEQTQLKLNSLPSGIAHDSVTNIIGRGCVINPSELSAEIQRTQTILDRIIQPRQLLISKYCSIITPEYIQIDKATSQTTIGTTGRGIGPTYAAKHARTGKTLNDVISEYPVLAPYVCDTELYIKEALLRGENILAEGAQGTWLDIDHGQRPYVTSCNTLASHACTTLGVGLHYVRNIIGVFKAYTTRVGEGPLEEEWDRLSGLYPEIFNSEFGTTTGRSRRCGPLNLPDLKQAIFMNGVNKLVMTKADLLNKNDFAIIEDSNSVMLKCIEPWNEASMTDDSFRAFVNLIEQHLDKSIDAVSNGPSRQDYDFNLLSPTSVLK